MAAVMNPTYNWKFPSINNFSGVPVAQKLLQCLFVWGFGSVFIAMQTKTSQMPAVKKNTPRTLSRPLRKMLATSMPLTLGMLDSSYKWNCAVFVLLWPAYFIYHVLQVYLCGCIMSRFPSYNKARGRSRNALLALRSCCLWESACSSPSYTGLAGQGQDKPLEAAFA